MGGTTIVKMPSCGLKLEWQLLDPVSFALGEACAVTPAPVSAPPAKKKDDDFDFFDDDDEEEEEVKETPAEMAARKKKEAAEKKKKAAPVGKSTIVFDVKPACLDGDEDDEDSGGLCDLDALLKHVKSIEHEGLLWGQNHQWAEIGYGIKKLQVQCTIVDDLCGVDDLVELIEANDDLVQSCDVVAFNKV